jgi:hypothetical protein
MLNLELSPMVQSLLKIYCVIAVAVVLVTITSVIGSELRPYQMREDYGTEPLSDCVLQYYYYVPCPTYSWFWAYTGLLPGEILGELFTIGDLSMGGFDPCDPYSCMELEQIRVLDFGGYGPSYPGCYTVEFDVYCSDEQGCPVGPSLWNSGPWETGFGWNYIPVDPAISICDCVVETSPLAYPRILVAATHTGTHGGYPAWGFDNVSAPILTGCEMHDAGCMPAFYPRPYSSHYTVVHSGFYGEHFAYCPPEWFRDGWDTTPDYSQFGITELAWRIYLSCTGPSGTEPSSWGSIKSMYR